MSAEDLWFGNEELFQLVTAPATMSAAREGYFDQFKGSNGGQVVERSSAGALNLELGYPWGDAYGDGTLEVFSDYRNGEYGSGLVHVADPMAYDTNLMPPWWASPRLIEYMFPVGWPNISPAVPSWAATAGNSYKQPARKGTWAVTVAANATPLTDATIPYVIIPIHPDRTLHFGCTGAATGTAVVKVESWVNGATSAAVSTSATLLAETGSTRLNLTVSGSSYAYAKIFITRTSSAASTITPISMMAQLHLTGSSPTLAGSHVRGRGQAGLEFADTAIPQEYLDASAGRHYKALSLRLKETQPWRS